MQFNRSFLYPLNSMNSFGLNFTSVLDIKLCCTLLQTMEIIPTIRGERKLLLEGYAYIVDRRKDNVTYWRCERKGRCGGRLKTQDDIVQGEASDHSHA